MGEKFASMKLVQTPALSSNHKRNHQDLGPLCLFWGLVRPFAACLSSHPTYNIIYNYTYIYI